MQIPDNLFSISEASNITGIKPHILRYWESEFKLLRPMKSDGGHRKYVKNDIELILYIKELLYKKRYTIAGAKKRLWAEKRDRDIAKTYPEFMDDLRNELKNILKLLQHSPKKSK